MDFERARELRDRLRALEHAALPQAVERHRPFDLDAIYAKKNRWVRLRVRRGAAVGLDGPFPLHELPEKAIEREDPTGPGPRLLVHGETDWRPLQAQRSIRISKPGRSYPGQLLEICRINHTYRVGTGAPRSELSSPTDQA